MTCENLSSEAQKVNPFRGASLIPSKLGGADELKKAVEAALSETRSAPATGFPTTPPALSEDGTPQTIRGCRSDFLEGCIDFITASKTATVFDLKNLKQAVQRFFTTCGEVRTIGKGAAHYDEGVDIAATGSITWREAPDGGFHVLVNLPGEAMRHTRNVLRVSDQEVAAFLVDLGFHFTRGDFAIDTRDDRITPKKVYSSFKNNLVTAKAKPGLDGKLCAKPHVRSVVGAGEEFTGVQFPEKRGGSGFFRCYDKVAECMTKTGAPPIDVEGKPVLFLTRFELETRGDRADACMRHFAQVGLPGIQTAFRSWMDFKDAKSAKNCERLRDAKSAAWWCRMMGEGVALKVSQVRIPATPEKLKKHCKVNLAPQIAKYQRAGLLDEWISMHARKAVVAESAVNQLRLYRADYSARSSQENYAIERHARRLRQRTEKILTA